jgi:hypothetical protein
MNFILEHGPLLFSTLEERRKIPYQPHLTIIFKVLVTFFSFGNNNNNNTKHQAKAPQKKAEIFGLSKLKRTLLLLLDTSSMWWMKYFAHRKVQNCRQRAPKKKAKMNQEESKTKLNSFIIEYTIAAKTLNPT